VKELLPQLYNLFRFFSLIPIILLFKVQLYAQTITITWYYDENQKFVIDDVSKTSTVGSIFIKSEKKFKIYVSSVVLDSAKVSVSRVMIGSKTISNNPLFPTKISTGAISGNLIVYFSYSSIPDDFRLQITFTFIPLY